MTRKWEKPKPVRMTPVHISGGFYLNLTDYARSQGMTRVTAYNRVQRGEVEAVKIGPKTVLVRIMGNKKRTV